MDQHDDIANCLPCGASIPYGRHRVSKGLAKSGGIENKKKFRFTMYRAEYPGELFQGKSK